MSIGSFRQIGLGTRQVRLRVRRNRRARRLSLRVSPDQLSLTLPPGVSEVDGLAFLMSRTDWALERLASFPAPTPFRPGETIPFRGRPRLLCLDPSTEDSPRLEEERILLASPERFAERLEAWLRHRARLAFEEAVARHAERLFVKPRSIAIRDQKTRWGSASPAGRLNFSWRAIMAPPFVLDYVAAHEVCHLIRMDHGVLFRTLCRSLAPETDAAERWLKTEGPALHRYGREPMGG